MIAKMRAGERYKMEHKEDGQKREIKVISRAGKATSKWGDNYNIQNWTMARPAG